MLGANSDGREPDVPQHQRCQRPMPIKLTSPYTHGRELKPITEQAALLDCMSGLFDFLGPGIGAIQQKLKILSPNLNVAGHRLAVQAQVIRNCAEENVQQLVLPFEESDFIFVT